LPQLKTGFFPSPFYFLNPPFFKLSGRKGDHSGRESSASGRGSWLIFFPERYYLLINGKELVKEYFLPPAGRPSKKIEDEKRPIHFFLT
jgi:hypothetical protein